MHAQCEQLLRLAELPNLTLRVMPLPHGARLGMNSTFAVLGFPEADDPDIAYIGHIAGSAQVEKPDEVRLADSPSIDCGPKRSEIPSRSR